MARLGNSLYVRYFLKIVSLNLMDSAEYRSSLFMTILSNYGYTIFSFIFIEAIAGMFGSVAGWGKYELLVGFCSMQLALYLWLMLLNYTNELPDYIREGKIDQILLKPINFLYAVSIRKMEIVSFMPGFLLQIGVLIYALNGLGIPFNLLNVILFCFSIIASTLIFQLFFLASYLLAFWITEPLIITRTFTMMFEGFARYPKEIYPSSIRGFFLTIFPVGLIAYVPASLILKGFSVSLIALQLSVLSFFFLLTLFIWHFGIRRYSGASG